ncbi:MAG: DHH family phosphoesterase, partial [Oscillospiraceae bacterium]|nr:DHH family phosphoesterase [Oscillospiraceae bacterium]
MNKKISRLKDQSMRVYFLCAALFAIATAFVSVPLAVGEAVITVGLWFYFRSNARKRRADIQRYIDEMTDDMTTADKASMLSAPFAMMVFRPDTQEILWSNDSFLQSTGVQENIFENRIGDVLPE